MADTYKVNLNSTSSSKLDKIAKQLGVNKKDIVEKGIKLMELYAQNQSENSNVSITVKKEDGDVENYVLL